jgi:site-specific DNA recombinase
MSTIRAVIYARVSTKPQASEDKISIPDQLRECRKFVQKEGWHFSGEFVDPGISANTIERPGLQKLLSMPDQFDVVLAWDFDRFYRERRSVAGYILDTLDEHRKQITSLKQPIPIYDPAQYDPRENDTPYMLREMAGFTSGIDNRRRFRTLQKGLKDRFDQGYMTRPPAYGYRLAVKVEDGKIVKLPRQIVPDEASVVRRIYREYLEGRSYHMIARGLNAEGTLSRKKPYWSDNVVRSVVRNPIYCGKVCRSCKTVKGRSKQLPEEQWIIVAGKHPAIVSERVWHGAQTIRKRKQQKARALAAPLLLSGLVRCGYCGYGMCKDGGWGGGYYICGKYKQTGECKRNSYRRVHLEEEVKAYVLKLLRTEDIFDAVTAHQQAEHAAELETEISRLRTMIAALPARKSRLFELYEKGDITRAEFRQRNEEHNQAARQSHDLLAQKEATLHQAISLKNDRETFQRLLGSLEENWDNCGLMQRKQRLVALIQKITIKERTFQIHLRLGESAAVR